MLHALIKVAEMDEPKIAGYTSH